MYDKKEYFTRFPNEYIQQDIKKNLGISRKFYITYILIDRYRSYEDYSWITVGKILEFYKYKPTGRKTAAFREVLDVLEYMIDNKMIEILQDLSTLSYDTGIEIKVIPEKFGPQSNFTKLTASQLDTIMMADNTLNSENLLIVFLYVCSHIGCRNKEWDDMKNGQINPEAFWGSIKSMSEDLSMSKGTINQCMQYLTTPHCGMDTLLVKGEFGAILSSKGKPPQNAPNIYVLNKDGYEQEIKLAMQKMSEMYNVN